MLKIIALITDQLFPPRPHERIVREVEIGRIKRLSRETKYRSIYYLLPYNNKLVEALIIENKFQRNIKAARILAQIVSTWIATQTDELVIVPIPLGPGRMKSRGYNQVMEILQHVTLTSTQRITSTMLRRTIDTVPQTSLNRTNRLNNIVGAFSCAGSESLQEVTGKTIVIIDDVTTTGATLEVARATLAPHLPPETTIICLAIAH